VILSAIDHINQLTKPFKTTERVVQNEFRLVPVPTLDRVTSWIPIQTGRLVVQPWVVEHEALLDQIEHTVTGSTGAGQVFHAAYNSKPAGRLDCLDLLTRIDRQSIELAEQWHLETGTLSPRERLTMLGLVLGKDQHRTVANWWAAARVLTQHDGPPVSPNVPCPEENCEQRGSLRVRFDPDVALCVACGATWAEGYDDPGNSFGRLVIWVKWASEHLNGPRHLAVDGSACSECLVEREQHGIRVAARHTLRETLTRRAGVNPKKRDTIPVLPLLSRRLVEVVPPNGTPLLINSGE
jgi:hypothetical protein